ncbi:competence protein ComFA [Enterococcus sp. PF1-24]|uniref:DEAD/DEAH box helicase n=1 Tax=unclassified Enterococcus TaxID=2608891 RepID=UPI002476F776|nr:MULTISPECIES: DEAD/DEAH box helicase [unclassified Enterococcus]MDH6364739.1 competence protein ComFA [Enterococcus sp. PFB1-1]MDH6401785.1 competence protein ComFA [Enterococcus sp. PF1-24]
MSELAGRRKVVAKKQQYQENKNLFYQVAMKKSGKYICCQRCNRRYLCQEVMLPNKNYYCPGCIQFGRITSRDALISERFQSLKRQEITFKWRGQLTQAQQQASRLVVKAIQEHKNLLLWAVTGAGKTEMLFAGLLQALRAGKRVAIASPRIDVCRELLPRFQAVFPDVDLLLLYGETQGAYRETNFLICTTHQLLHFYQAFDVLIIDEIDAFPFDVDERLAYAAKNVVKPLASVIYLTATPTKQFFKELPTDFVVHKIPVRYHGRPLPEPKLFWWNQWQRKSLQGKKLKPLIKLIQQLLKKSHILLFCPSIDLMTKLTKQLQQQLAEVDLTAVSAETSTREAIILKMRQQEYQLLLCTTILERGVTFEKISVIVLGANHRVYTKKALIQIAGRVDRTGSKACGEVYYVYDEMTAAIRQACREIREMNQRGSKKGFL